MERERDFSGSYDGESSLLFLIVSMLVCDFRSLSSAKVHIQSLCVPKLDLA